MTEKRKEYHRNYQKAYYAKNREKISARKKELRYANLDHYHELERASAKRRYARAMLDPDLYARMTSHKRTDEYRIKENIKKKEWRKCHKKLCKRQNRFRYDRERALCRQDPEYYAVYRKQKRAYAAERRRKKGLVKRKYIPKICMRIPDECTYGKVLDTRSVFLWNNKKAASLIAGRDFRAMQWREEHCDRFGMVCR